MRRMVMPTRGGAVPPVVERIASACGPVCVPDNSHAAKLPPRSWFTVDCAELKFPNDTLRATNGQANGNTGAPLLVRLVLMFENKSRLFQLASRNFASVMAATPG